MCVHTFVYRVAHERHERPDLSDALDELVEAALLEVRLALLVVEDETLDHELAQRRCGSDAELRGLVAVDAVANHDDGIEVVELDCARDLPLALGSNRVHRPTISLSASDTQSKCEGSAAERSVRSTRDGMKKAALSRGL